MNKTPFYKTGLDFGLPGIKAKPVTGSSGVKDNGGGGGADWTQGDVQLNLSNVAAAEEKINETDGKDDTRLQRRIDKATKQGKEDKVARLQGRQDRQDVRQKSRADREIQRNVEREEVTQERQDRKTERFKSRRAGADGVYGNEDDTAPVSSAGMLLNKIGGLFRKDDTPTPSVKTIKKDTPAPSVEKRKEFIRDSYDDKNIGNVGYNPTPTVKTQKKSISKNNSADRMFKLFKEEENVLETPVYMKMSAKQYAQEQRNSKIAKNI